MHVKKENTGPPKQIAGCDHRPEFLVEKPLKMTDFMRSKVTHAIGITKMLEADVPKNRKPPFWSSGLSLQGASSSKLVAASPGKAVEEPEELIYPIRWPYRNHPSISCTLPARNRGSASVRRMQATRPFARSTVPLSTVKIEPKSSRERTVT